MEFIAIKLDKSCKIIDIYRGLSCEMDFLKDLIGKNLYETDYIKFGEDRSSAVYKDIKYEVQELKNSEEEFSIILYKSSEKLLKNALDRIYDGIQIYNEKGEILFFNSASKELVGIEDNELYGKHLNDIFKVDEDYSTTLTALKSGKMVENRFDNYEGYRGKKLITVNTAYPVYEDGSLTGVISFERDINSLSSKINQLKEIKNSLAKQSDNRIYFDNQTKFSFADIIAISPAMSETIGIAQDVAQLDSNVLIQGETGTGKEMFAQSMHRASGRAKEKFVALNCAAVPETLIESVLFGTVKGAFTGSLDKAGLFEEGNKGTVFLDEINSMSLSMQAKILRAIQEKTIRRVGGMKDIAIDIRIIASCNEDVFDLIERKVIRRDLYYRIAAVVIEIPPLRERKGDIEALVLGHLKNSKINYCNNIVKIEQSFWDCLKAHEWYGNVRELFHAIDYSVNTTKDGVLKAEDLPTRYVQKTAEEEKGNDKIVFDDTATLQEVMDGYEEEYLKLALKSNMGQISKTAEMLGIKRQSLQYRIKKYGIQI